MDRADPFPKNAIEAALTDDYHIPPSANDRELANYELTDLGNAKRLKARFGADLKYCSSLGWLFWTGKYWQAPGDEMRARKCAFETAEAISEEVRTWENDKRTQELSQERPDIYKKQRDAKNRFAQSSQNMSRIKGMLDASKPFLNYEESDLDQRLDCLNVENATLHLQDTIEPRVHRREDRLTLCAPTGYNPEAPCLNWIHHLKICLPDQDVRLFVQRLLGYCLTGRRTEQKICFWIGSGANGKSTTLNVLRHVLGPYLVTAQIETFLRNDKRAGGDPSPDLTRLKSARIVATSEPEPGARLSESSVKLMTGSEPMMARDLYKQPFEFQPQFMAIIGSNTRPTIRGNDDGIWRRILIVPWTASIAPEDQDPEIEKKLKEEASGILNWLLDGYTMWREAGLSPPKSVQRATNEYRRSCDPLAEFLDTCIERDANGRVQAKDLYEAYKEFCETNAHDPLSMRRFGELISERDIPKSRIAGRIFRLNIRLKKRELDHSLAA